MMKGFGMRKLVVLVLLLCGPPSADADSWCSDGFEAPAVLSDSGTGYELKMGNKIERFEYTGPVGTGMNGRVLATGEVLNSAEIVNAPDPDNPETNTIQILRDRVFWPCNKNE
jgi:hypothetical protein